MEQGPIELREGKLFRDGRALDRGAVAVERCINRGANA
jgi:hypothetical protein